MAESLEEQWRFLKEKSWDGGEEAVRQTIYLNRKVSMENKPRYHTRENHDWLEARLGPGRCIYCLAGCKILEPGEKIEEP
jgi:hypothetical protein